MTFMPIKGMYDTGLQGMAAPTPFSFPTVQRPTTPVSNIQQPMASQQRYTDDYIGVATGGNVPYGFGPDYGAYDPSGNLFANPGPLDPVTGRPRYWTDPETGAIVAWVDAQGNITSATGAGGNIEWFGDEEAPTTLDIPTGLYPTATSTSASESGLYPEFKQPLMDLIKTLSPAAGEYMNLLGQASTPGAFQASFNPIMEGTVDKIVEDLAKRGLIDSGEKSKLLQQASQAVPQAWLSNLLNIAGQYGEAAKLPILGIGEARYGTSGGTSLSENPLAPYELMVNLLLGT